MNTQKAEGLISSPVDSLTHPKYRADVDGLRAIAVLAVVGFHAFPQFVKGGFIGVDIFFVISGYLISTILFKSLEQETFSFIDFYGRRIRRIFPALLVVMVFCLVFGWFLLMPDEYRQLGKHIKAGAAFIVNIVLQRENGYFDTSAETKPLLHLWSLGIEEQYYIIWPVLLWFAWKIRFNFLRVTLLLMILSFGMNLMTYRFNQSADFYLPQNRFWELLAGSVLAYIKLHPLAFLTQFKVDLETRLCQLFRRVPNDSQTTTVDNTLSWLGVGLILNGMMFTNEKQFPGVWAVLPVIGAVFIISAGTRAWLNRVILSHPFLVSVGLISFPLYLWHWPILSLLRTITVETPGAAYRALAVLLAFILAWLTYMLVEKPIRFQLKSKWINLILLFLMVCVGLGGYTLIRKNGFGTRMGKEKLAYADYFENAGPKYHYFKSIKFHEKFRTECNFYQLHQYLQGKATNFPRESIDASCYQPNPLKSKRVLLWGDSHAQQLYPGLKNNLPGNWQILTVASSGCTPDETRTSDSKTDYCKHSNWFALKTIREARPDVIVVAQIGNHNVKKMTAINNALKSFSGAKVVFTGPTPQWQKFLHDIVLKYYWVYTPKRTQKLLVESVMNTNLFVERDLKNNSSLIYVDIIKHFCNQSGCLIYLGNDRKLGLTTFDNSHLSLAASDNLAKEVLVDIILNNTNKR